MNNLLIRVQLLKNAVRTKELAEILHISERTMYRKLCNELPEEEQARISSMIIEYAAKRGGQNHED